MFYSLQMLQKHQLGALTHEDDKEVRLQLLRCGLSSVCSNNGRLATICIGAFFFFFFYCFRHLSAQIREHSLLNISTALSAVWLPSCKAQSYHLACPED